MEILANRWTPELLDYSTAGSDLSPRTDRRERLVDDDTHSRNIQIWLGLLLCGGGM
ncbi:hypothetical protein U1Q18_018186, partial [Sarracenia purpurea var. burkii]